MSRRKLILDVDTGIDDAMALLYAVASPDAELLVATCAPGNASLEAVVRNTRGVLDVAGASDIDVMRAPVHHSSNRSSQRRRRMGQQVSATPSSLPHQRPSARHLLTAQMPQRRGSLSRFVAIQAR